VKTKFIHRTYRKLFPVYNRCFYFVYITIGNKGDLGYNSRKLFMVKTIKKTELRHSSNWTVPSRVKRIPSPNSSA